MWPLPTLSFSQPFIQYDTKACSLLSPDLQPLSSRPTASPIKACSLLVTCVSLVTFVNYAIFQPFVHRPATYHFQACNLSSLGLQPLVKGPAASFSFSFLLVTCVNYVSHIQASIPGIQPMHTAMQPLVLMWPASLIFSQLLVLRPVAYHIQAYSLSSHSLQPLVSQPASSDLNVTFVNYVFFFNLLYFGLYYIT